MPNPAPAPGVSQATALLAHNRRMALPLRPALPWRPSLFLRLSAALHGLALLAVLAWPGQWLFWLGALVINHLALSTIGLWPRSAWLGANLTRLPPAAAARGEVALTFDDGPDPHVTPQVLDQLDAASARATFFCVGEQLRRHPELAREIVRRGHHIENHTDTHPHLFAAMGWRRMAAQVADGQHAVASVSGRAPRFFRAVAGLRNPWLDPILARHGLQLATWTRRGYDTRTGDATAVLARLTHALAAGDILLLHDGHAARTANGQAVVLAVLPRLLAELRARGLRSVPLAEALPETSAAPWQGVIA